MFLASASLLERLYWRVTTGFRQRLDRDAARPVQTRLAARSAARLLLGLGWVAAFAAGSLGAFLLFDWPPLLHGLIARCLLIVRGGLADHGHAALHPGAGRGAVPHPADEHGHLPGYWYRWLTADRRLVHRRQR